MYRPNWRQREQSLPVPGGRSIFSSTSIILYGINSVIWQDGYYLALSLSCLPVGYMLLVLAIFFIPMATNIGLISNSALFPDCFINFGTGLYPFKICNGNLYDAPGSIARNVLAPFGLFIWQSTSVPCSSDDDGSATAI